MGNPAECQDLETKIALSQGALDDNIALYNEKLTLKTEKEGYLVSNEDDLARVVQQLYNIEERFKIINPELEGLETELAYAEDGDKSSIQVKIDNLIYKKDELLHQRDIFRSRKSDIDYEIGQLRTRIRELQTSIDVLYYKNATNEGKLIALRAKWREECGGW